MSLFDRIFAAIKVPAVDTPKVPRKALALPSFLRSAPNPANVLPRTDRNLANVDVTTFRSESDSRATIRKFVAASPDLSAAVFAYLRVGITDKYVAVARNLDGTFNTEATASLQAILQRMDVLGSYSDGFSSGMSIRSVSESLTKELVMYGSCAGELVIDKAGFPKRIQPISVTQIEYKAEKDGTLKPVQKTSAGEIDLDYPSVFIVNLDQDTLDVYSSSPIESAIQSVLFSEDFVNDLRRIIKKVIHPRQQVVIDEEKLRKSIPQDIINDPEAVTAYFNSVISGIETKLRGLQPEDAIVTLDVLGISLENNGNVSLADEWTFVKEAAQGRLAASTKVPAIALGYSSASSNIASTESLLFMKNANGVVTAKLNEFFSKLLTLSVRLMGYDVVVDFKYAPIDLRPESELEGFKAAKVSRVLDLLSIGMLGDEEACLELTGKLPPVGYKPLSGTMFRSKGAVPDQNELNGGASNQGSALNKAITPDTPSQTRGGNKKADADTVDIEALVEAAQPTFVTPNITVAIDNTQRTSTKLKMQRDDDGNLTIERMEDVG